MVVSTIRKQMLVPIARRIVLLNSGSKLSGGPVRNLLIIISPHETPQLASSTLSLPITH